MQSDLGFDLSAEFKGSFTSAAGYLKVALDGPPTGKAYTASVTALNKLAEILDRLFNAFGQPEELAKVACLREGSEKFQRDYGAHRLGEAMRGLLAGSGFERQDPAGSGAVWVFPYEDALARLRGLTVRLCLQKFTELQKARGPGRFLHKDNSAVVPAVEDATFSELVDLYRGHLATSPQERPSTRERNFEAEVRIKLNERRAEKGVDALSLHEGLASIARGLADAQRKRARKDADDLYPRSSVANEVRTALARLPLPPGFTVAHLHWSSTELPKLFQLTSTRGGATAGKDEAEDEDSAEGIMAREAAGYWAARQREDTLWPRAAIVGVGSALDYTVNKGFAVALLVGYEQEGDDLGLASATGQLRRRHVAAAAAPARQIEPVKFTPAGSHQTRITGFRDLPSKPKGGG